MPARLRGAAFCTPGRRGLRDGVCHVWARGLRGGTARLAWINTAGVVCSRQKGSEERGLREVRVCPAPPRRWGRRGRTHPSPHAPQLSAGQTQRGDTPAPARESRRAGRPGAHRRAGTRRGLAGPALRRHPPAALLAVVHTPAPGKPGEAASVGRTLRRAWLTWGVAGGWAAFRAGGGRQDEEEECGRSGRKAGAVGRGPGR